MRQRRQICYLLKLLGNPFTKIWNGVRDHAPIGGANHLRLFKARAILANPTHAFASPMSNFTECTGPRVIRSHRAGIIVDVLLWRIVQYMQRKTSGFFWFVSKFGNVEA